jgi:hypothetical protein
LAPTIAISVIEPKIVKNVKSTTCRSHPGKLYFELMMACLLPFLLTASIGLDVGGVLLAWRDLPFLPAAEESLARGPERLAAGPGSRLALYAAPTREVLLLSEGRVSRRFPARATGGIAFRGEALLILDLAARDLSLWSLEGARISTLTLPGLAPSGLALELRGEEAWGRDLFGNLHPLARVTDNGLSAPDSGGLVRDTPLVAWVPPSGDEPGTLRTTGLELPLPGVFAASGRRLGDWLVVDAVVGDRPLRVERRAWHVPTRSSAPLPVEERLYAPHDDLAVTPEGGLRVLVPLAEGLRILEIEP